MCRKIDSVSYAISDAYVICNSDFYKNYILPINIPILSLTGVIVPLFLFRNLYQINK